MSFMYNPFPYDDPKPVNRPELSEDTIKSIVKGSDKAAAVVAADIADRMKAGKENVIIGFDGYTTACWKTFLNLLGRRLTALGIGIEIVDFEKVVFKSGEEIDAMIDPLLEWDTKKVPTLLFGKIYKGGYEGFIDPAKAERPLLFQHLHLGDDLFVSGGRGGDHRHLIVHREMPCQRRADFAGAHNGDLHRDSVLSGGRFRPAHPKIQSHNIISDLPTKATINFP